MPASSFVRGAPTRRSRRGHTARVAIGGRGRHGARPGVAVVLLDLRAHRRADGGRGHLGDHLLPLAGGVAGGGRGGGARRVTTRPALHVRRRSRRGSVAAVHYKSSLGSGEYLSVAGERVRGRRPQLPGG